MIRWVIQEGNSEIKIKEGLDRAKTRSSKTIYGAITIVQVADYGSKTRRSLNKANRISQDLTK